MAAAVEVGGAYLDAPDPVEATRQGLALTRGILAGHRIDPRPLAVETMTEEELERRVKTPNYPDLVDATEVAEILGLSRQRVHQLRRQHPDFPTPLYTPRIGPLWTRAVIEAFARSWTRRPGRPAKRAS